MEPKDILTELQSKLPAMTSDLELLVNNESPSRDFVLLAHCADVLNEIGERILGKSAEVIDVDGWKHLLWTFGDPKVLLVGHYDTVWPAHAIDNWKFAIDGDKATGPGIFDMKSGIILALYAMALGDVPDGVAILITADEEIGSWSSIALIEKLAKQSQAALILEAPHHGAIKVGRKGVSFYQFEIEGKAAHAGLEPELGANALVELAHRVLLAQSLAKPEIGTTVNATVATAGTTTNVIPAHATLDVDARAETKQEQQRVHDALMNTPVTVEGTTIRLAAGGMNRPPFDTSSSTELFAIAQKVAPQVGIDNLEGIVVGGGSDGNFTSAVGCKTLDGLGALGDGAHAEGEWISVSSMAERGAFVRGIVDEILTNGI